ncbi:MAG: hypothetical protein AB1765_13280, partial [Candidatus Hydrogenedentota bacterium]
MDDFNNFRYLGAVEIFVLSPCKTKVLLMKRSEKRAVLPGFYAGLGGKMDSNSIESAYDTAVREIKE